MKPHPDLASFRWLSRHDRPNDAHAPVPLVACDFQPRRFGGSFGGSGLPWRRPNFSSLAKEALRADASRSFRLESAVLGFITLVSAWPIAVMIREVIRLLK